MVLTRKRKRARYGFYSCCQDLIKNLHSHFSSEKQRNRVEPALNRVKDRLVTATGLSRASITRLLSDIEYPEPGESVTRDRPRKLTDEELARIRPAVLRLVRKKTHITLTRLHQELQNEPEGWNTCRTTLWSALKSIGFEFSNKKAGYYSAMRENEANIQLRGIYLTTLERYKEENRQIVYMDETWLNKNTQPSCIWHDKTLDTVDSVPSGKGQRWIVLGAGSKDGWIENSIKIWKGNTKSEDYHTEMNSDVLNDWLVNFCLPNMKRDGVLVMDRAPYHVSCSEDTKPPQSNWKKEDLAAYILKHDTNNIYTEHMLLHQEHEVQFLREGEDGRRRVRTRKGFLRTMLLNIAKDMAPPKVMRVTETLNQWNTEHNTDIKILLLPIAHPQLNPIELVWSWVKTEVAKRNKDFKMKTLHALIVQRINEITPEMWRKSCRRSDGVAREYMEVDDMNEEDEDDDNDSDENNEGSEENNEGLSDT